MGQFGLQNGHHWGYGATTPYSSYLGAGTLSSCAAATPTASGFNSTTPAIGFTPSDTNHSQDFNQTTTATSAGNHKVDYTIVIILLIKCLKLINWSLDREV